MTGVSTTLNGYIEQSMRLLRDGGQKLINPADLRDYVNRARREVAMRSQSIRRLTPISAGIESATVVSGGVSYGSNVSIILSAPDFPSGQLPDPNGRQATASAVIINGSVQSISMDDGGAGYFQPSMTLVDQDTGYSAASISLTVGYYNAIYRGQEVYPFSSINLSMWPGVDAVFSVRSLSIIYANYRYSLPQYAFSTYQAMIRQYPYQYQYVPSMSSQFGQGVDGSFYVYPLPSQTYQCEWDCLCVPSDLVDETSFEALPYPWRDAVPYMSAYYAFLELQNFNYARFMEQQFEKYVAKYSAYTRPGRWTNPYGRF